MSTIDGTPTPSGVGPGGRWRRTGQGTNDYFGPQATAGPYTEGTADGVGRGPAGVRGAVPISPQGPGDIVPAVEIGGEERRAQGGEGRGEKLGEVGNDAAGVESAPPYEEGFEGQVGEGGLVQGTRVGRDTKEVPETPDHRFELP